MSLCASVYMCFVVTCWERADLLALVCGVYCEFVTFPLFVCFVALRPKSTAMVIAGRSVHLTTLFFLGKLEQAVNQYFVHILSLVTDNNPS